eukprot:3414707-Rhodomonas_salina.1
MKAKALEFAVMSSTTPVASLKQAAPKDHVAGQNARKAMTYIPYMSKQRENMQNMTDTELGKA